MTLTRDDLVTAARKLWGPENPKLTRKDEMRWGTHGSKRITLSDDPSQLFWAIYEPPIDEKGGVVELCRRAGIMDNAGSDEWGAETVYKYFDEHSKLLFEVVRKPGHKFLQRHYDEQGNKVWNLKGVRRVLYRLPQLINAHPGTDIVYVVEGEKDAENLGKLGFVTTTNPGGAGKWKPDFSLALKDFDVVILPDNDAAGHIHAAKVKAALTGVAHSCRILKLPGLDEKGDVSDWISSGGTAAALRELVDLLADDDEADTGWINQCQLSKGGEPLPNFANALCGLRADPKLKNLFTFDKMLRQSMITRSEPVPVLDKDISEVHEYLQLVGLRRLSRDTVRWAVHTRAGEHPYHPVLEKFKALQWDGNKRIEIWLSVYLGAEANAYNNAIGAMFLISLVARIFQPGCKVDHMLVLEGPQGALKSMACEVLAGGPDYFSDHLPDITQGKEVSQHLRGKMIVEISEMHAFNRAEATALKAFLSRPYERYRPPYAENEVDEPRQCVFIGTSNKDMYLRDETGGRRFWPVKCRNIDINALREDRDQLIAEAIVQFHDGVPWWPDKDFEKNFIEPEQEARFEFDAWFDAIKANLQASTLDDTTVWEVAQGLGFENRKQLGMFDQKRITSCLRALGCEYRHTRGGNKWKLPQSLSGKMV